MLDPSLSMVKLIMKQLLSFQTILMVRIYGMYAQKRVSLLSGTSIVFTYFLYHFNFFIFYRAEREYVVQEDFMKAVRKVADNKKLESKLDYKPI